MSHTVISTQDKNTSPSASERLPSLDMLRGVVMVLMTLDHTRTFFSNATFSPLDLNESNIPFFLTRWITHLCAPSFIFLAGIAANRALKRGRTKTELSRFLLIRGLWLIFLELTIIRLAWSFTQIYTINFAGVLWAIGWSMLCLSILVYLPIRTVGIIGFLLIFGHNLLDGINADQFGQLHWAWAILHEQKMLEFSSGFRFFIFYPLIPWIGVMAAGYAFGTLYDRPLSQRQSILRNIGLSCLAIFLLLRGTNIYGDPEPWSFQSNFIKSLLSFINCHKYPPSLLYLLMTLGLAILLLYLFETSISRYFKPVIFFGQVPLFFYIIHLWTIHLIAIILSLPKYGLSAILLPYISTSMRPEDYGYSLVQVYFIFLVIIVILYPICYWYGKYKKKSKYWLLKYF